jgi:hypothetical protein
MINDLPPRKEAQAMVPEFGIGEAVVFTDGTVDILHVTGIVVRGAGLFTYLVSDRGHEVEVRDFQICSYDSLPDAEDEEDEE